MKAINVDQPFAELIISGRKSIELRKTNTSHRGPLIIHATQTVLYDRCQKFRLDPETLPAGLIIGVVNLIEVIKFDQKLWDELRDQHLSDARTPGLFKYGWRLTKPLRLAEPVYVRALRGMFAVPEETATLIQSLIQNR